jgi:hypothetical protein
MLKMLLMLLLMMMMVTITVADTTEQAGVPVTRVGRYSI